MATENKAAASPDSPELANLKFREKELIEKQKRIEAHPKTRDHDLDGAKKRCDTALAQVRAEIKRLSK